MDSRLPFVTSNLAAVIADLESYATVRVRHLATVLATELSKATPKDTTHAASEWIWGRNPRYYAIGSKLAPAWGAFFSALADLSTWTIATSELYLDNAVDYIKALDEGYSPQAAPDFIGYVIRSVLRRFGARGA